MGWRFRKVVRIGGLRVNLSKSGASLSVGPRGADLNVSARGMRTTAGLPGTGVSYSSFRPWNRAAAPGSGRPPARIGLAVAVVVVVLIGMLLLR